MVTKHEREAKVDILSMNAKILETIQKNNHTANFVPTEESRGAQEFRNEAKIATFPQIP